MPINRPTGGMYQPYIYNQHNCERGLFNHRGGGWIIYPRIISTGSRVPTGHTMLLRRLINVIDVHSTLLQRRVTSGSVAR